MTGMAIIAASDTYYDFDDGGDNDDHHHDGDDRHTIRRLIARTKLTTGMVYQHDGGHSAGHHFG